MCFISILLIIAIPLTEFIIVGMYGGQEYCSSIISPNAWLVVDGVVALVFNFVYFAGAQCINSMTGSNKRGCSVAFLVFVYAFSFFSLAWVIIGSVMFFRDCKGESPTQE